MTTYLKDEDIRLRAVEPGDAPIIWDIESDSTQWVDNGQCAPFSIHNIEEYVKNYDADPIRAGQLRLMIERNSDRKTLGAVDLYDISAANRHAFIGIYIFPDYRRMRIAEKAILLLETYCRQLLNFNALGAKVSEKNVASRQLFTLCGYSLCGTIPQWLISGNEKYSLCLYSKLL